MPARDNPLFGTDGIRGRWGTPPIDPVSITRLGHALDTVLGPCRLLVGEDPRESSAWIRDHLLGGMSARIEAGVCGVIPTPGLSWALRNGDWDWGVMITASHNPWMDNGIKLFSGDGSKADDEVERLVTEAFHASVSESAAGAGRDIVPVADGYADALAGWGSGLDGNGISLVIDAANGATAKFAADLFPALGYAVDLRHAQPDGRNINENCGATRIDVLQAAVFETGADLGITFDGDGDRALFVNADGGVISGDHVLFALAGAIHDDPARYPAGVVGTVMSNMGLEAELKRRKIEFRRAGVGDRDVARVMRRTGFILGGEPSGHTIYFPLQPTGDGLLTALLLLRELGRDPAEAGVRLCRKMTWFAQETRSVSVEERRDLESWPELERFRRRIDDRHGNRVRLLIRYSGTEPRLRLMAEAETDELVRAVLDELEDLVRNG